MLVDVVDLDFEIGSFGKGKGSLMQLNKAALLGPSFAFAVFAGSAKANIEPPAAYDARSVGMGSTGVAHVHNGASLFHNPAALAGVEKGAITADFAPLLPKMNAPLAAPETVVGGERGLFPMFLVGGAYRLDKRFTVGLAAYPTMGLAAKYKNRAELGGLELSTKLAAIEIAPGAAFSLTDDIAVGLAYRVTYMSYSTHMPTAVAPPNVTEVKLDASGWNFLGIQAGAFARLTQTTRLGLTYRNKVPVTMKGNTDMGGQSYKSELEFAAPHAFKLGVAQTLMDDRLLLALDVKLALYKNSGKSLSVKTETPVGTQTTETSLDWKNSLGACAGAEYRFAPNGPRARLGYSVTQSATPENRAAPILLPPGLQHSIHVGTGMSFSNVDVDLGGYYLFGGHHAAPEGGVPGDYSMNAILIALGATYRL